MLKKKKDRKIERIFLVLVLSIFLINLVSAQSSDSSIYGTCLNCNRGTIIQSGNFTTTYSTYTYNISSLTCSGTDKFSAFDNSTGLFTCSTDETTAGGTYNATYEGGIASLNATKISYSNISSQNVNSSVYWAGINSISSILGSVINNDLGWLAWTDIIPHFYFKNETYTRAETDANLSSYNISLTNYINTKAGDNSSWNESYADTLYYGASNPSNFINSTFNSTYDNYKTNVSINYTLQTYNTYNDIWSSTYNATYASNTGNASWNQSFANSLYAPNTTAGIQFLVNNSINKSAYWNDYGSANATQIINSNGILTILESWLSSFWESMFRNYFDQSLNKTDNAVFNRLNITSSYLCNSTACFSFSDLNATGTAGTEPAWNGNYTIFTGLINNASYLSTYNATYARYSTNVSNTNSNFTGNITLTGCINFAGAGSICGA